MEARHDEGIHYSEKIWGQLTWAYPIVQTVETQKLTVGSITHTLVESRTLPPYEPSYSSQSH